MRNPPSKRSTKASKGPAPSRLRQAVHADKSVDASHNRAAILAELEQSEFAKRNTAGGRKPPYKAEYANTAKAMCERGATTGQLAEVLEVSIETVLLWIVTEPEFFEACKIVEDACDERIKRSMFESGLVPNSAAAKSWFDRARKDRVENRLIGNDPAGSPLSRLYDAICGHSFQPVEHVPGVLQIEGKAEDDSNPK